MQDAQTTAKVILSLVNPELEVISNLKLQKLMYYAQGFNLAAFDRPLYDAKIIAWQYGPVVKEIYNEYKNSGSTGIVVEKPIKKIGELFKTKKEYHLFKEVYKVYSQYSALKLMEMTHAESPWVTTRINSEITHEKLKRFFKTRLVAN